MPLDNTEVDAAVPAAGTPDRALTNAALKELIVDVAARGDVSKVGTPTNNQVGVWTGDGTIEGDAALTFDTTTDALLIGAGSVTRAGAHLATITTTATTNVTLPTSGTLVAANAPATISGATTLNKGTHGNRLLVCDTAATHSVDDDTGGSWAAGDVLYGINTSAGSVILQGDGTSTVTAETGQSLTVLAGQSWSLSRTGTNAWRGGAVAFRETIIVPIGDETTAITTGTAKVTFRMPFAMTVTAVRASLATTSSSGTPTFDINEGGTTILSTKLTIDASELTSTTAADAAVISDASLADDASITIDVDTAGTGAAGAKIYIIGTRA